MSNEFYKSIYRQLQTYILYIKNKINQKTNDGGVLDVAGYSQLLVFLTKSKSKTIIVVSC